MERTPASVQAKLTAFAELRSHSHRRVQAYVHPRPAVFCLSEGDFMSDSYRRSDSDLSRRKLLQLTGAAAFVSACSSPKPAEVSAVPAATVVPTPPSATPPQPVVDVVPVAPAPVEAPIMKLELCRDAWGASLPRPGGRPHKINRMTLHHTAVVLGENSNIVSRLQQHQHYHQDVKGWVDIAYHVGVDRNGNIFELRTTDIAGDTATNYDPWGHLLVVCEGNFDEEPISEEQLNSAAWVFAWATQRFGISSDTLASHQEVTPTTACPGANLQARVASGDLKRRIDDFARRGPIDLQRFCGGQAFARVAQIEAGG